MVIKTAVGVFVGSPERPSGDIATAEVEVVEASKRGEPTAPENEPGASTPPPDSAQGPSAQHMVAAARAGAAAGLLSLWNADTWLLKKAVHAFTVQAPVARPIVPVPVVPEPIPILPFPEE
jgi:hypothetical protein